MMTAYRPSPVPLSHVQVMMTAYRPSPVPLSHVASELCLEQDGADVVQLLEAAGGRCVGTLQGGPEGGSSTGGGDSGGMLDTLGSRPMRLTVASSTTSWVGADRICGRM